MRIGGQKGQAVEEISTMANIAVKMAEKCFGTVIAKKKGKKEVLGEAGAVVASGSGLYGMPGSYEDTRTKIRKALEDSQLYGKYPEIISMFPKKIFVSADHGQETKYYEIEWSMSGDEVKIGAAKELERKVQFIIKEIAEACITELEG